MKRIVQMLLVMAFVAPLVSVANAETMAERKQRIMRKYLRERQNVTQSDMVVPATTEDVRITDSEKFQQLKVNLSRQTESSPVQVPMVQAVPVQARKSWLFGDTTDTDSDPYADPFADHSGDKNKDTKTDSWTQWKTRQEEMAKEKQPDPSSTYDYTGSGRYSYGSGNPGYGYSGQRQDGNSRYGSGYGSSGYGQRSYYTGYDNGQQTPYGTGSYDSSPSGMLQSPYPSSQQGSYDPMHPSSTGYTPYKSPYQTQQQNQQQAKPQQQQKFNRPKPYQQWKKENKAWDPAADDAYLDELMKKNRQ